MNVCIMSGKVISDITYNFLYNSKKNIAILKLKLEIDSKTIVDVCALDEIADKIYKNVKTGDFLLLEGKIERNDKMLQLIVTKFIIIV